MLRCDLNLATSVQYLEEESSHEMPSFSEDSSRTTRFSSGRIMKAYGVEMGDIRVQSSGPPDQVRTDDRLQGHSTAQGDKPVGIAVKQSLD